MRVVSLISLVVLFVVSGFSQDILATSPNVVSVPSDQYPTIESAVTSCAAPIVEVNPGLYIYDGSTSGPQTIYIYPCSFGMITIRKAQGTKGEVVIRGGANANTITLGINASARFESITVTNLQQRAYYDTAAVLGWGGVTIEMDNCFVYTASLGVSSSYAVHTTITNSHFIGWNNNAIGVYLSLQNPLDRDTGARIYNNEFDYFLFGIYHFELVDEATTPTLQRCKGSSRKCVDSNTYYQVAYPYYFTMNIE